MASVSTVVQPFVETYEEIAQRAIQVRDVLASLEIRVKSGSSLCRFLRRAESLAKEWGSGGHPSIELLCDAGHVNRLCRAILSLQDDPALKEPLRRIAKNVVMPNDRMQSQGKDSLWEIVLLGLLREGGAAARFEDPPDILVEMDGWSYPVACKKVWKESGLEEHVRKAGRQLRSVAKGAGVIALNLDDIVPPGRLLDNTDRDSAGAFLHQFNLDFIERHRSLFERAVHEGRCDGVWVSVCTAAVIGNEETPFNMFTQHSLWTLTSTNGYSKHRMERLAAIASQGDFGTTSSIEK